MRSARVLRVALLVVVACGLGLRIRQYSANNALWLDEIAIARNVIERPLASLLTEPLRYHQSAPKGFLLAEKVAFAVGGPGELTLRAWPFAASVAALIGFSILAVRALEAWGALVAVACLAFAMPLIVQTSELKQYSTELAVAVLLMLLTWPHERPSRKRDITTGVVGAIAIWFSQPAVFVALAMALWLARQAWPNRGDARRRFEDVWRASLWTASAAAATLVAIRSMTPDTRDFMQRFWEGGFLGEAFLRELDTFRGRSRVWVVVTHAISTMVGQRRDLLGYLDAIGQRRTEIVVPSNRAFGMPLPAEAFLYDLSDPARLSQMTAERFQPQGTYTRTAKGCREGPISMVYGDPPDSE